LRPHHWNIPSWGWAPWNWQWGIILAIGGFLYAVAGTRLTRRVRDRDAYEDFPFMLLFRDKHLGDTSFLTLVMSASFCIPAVLFIVAARFFSLTPAAAAAYLFVGFIAVWAGSRFTLRLRESKWLTLSPVLSWRIAFFATAALMIAVGLVPQPLISLVLLFAAGFTMKIGYMVAKNESQAPHDKQTMRMMRDIYSSIVRTGMGLSAMLFAWMMAGHGIGGALIWMGIAMGGFETLIALPFARLAPQTHSAPAALEFSRPCGRHGRFSKRPIPVGAGLVCGHFCSFPAFYNFFVASSDLLGR
jgi:hypothetical protein